MQARGQKVSLSILVVLAAIAALARAREKPDVWLEVKSPHFTVVSDATEKQARRVAFRFEQIRAVFQISFAKHLADPTAPITVLAAKGEKSFNELQPSGWNQKGALKRSGLFQQTPEKNYVLLNLAAESDDPFHVLFHEYTHLLVHQNTPQIPLWLDEGLAEFYGYSEIHEKEIWLGRPSPGHVMLLRQAPLIPLKTLFSVGHDSPFYNEQNKGSIFYAESWALTHYLMLQDLQEKKSSLSDYVSAVGKGGDAIAEGERAFGDLEHLQKQLVDYARGSGFRFFRFKASAEVDEDAFQTRALSLAESETARGDFLIYLGRYDDARSMLSDALQLDPKDSQATESMGFLEFQQRHREEAERWFTQAVALDSKSYLAHYYFAVMALRGWGDPGESSQIEKSLKTAVQVNPRFAPAYDTLAQFYAMKGENLEEAHQLALQAITLEPGNVHYYLTTANVFLVMKNPQSAVYVCRTAQKLAKSPEESAAVASLLASATLYAEALDAQKQAAEARKAAREAGANAPSPAPAESLAGQEAQTPQVVEDHPPALRHRNEEHGPRDVAEGVIKSAKCVSSAGLDLVFQIRSGALRLHTDNYFKVDFRALNFTPKGPLNPCQQLTGMKARIFFYAVSEHPGEGELIAVELKE